MENKRKKRKADLLLIAGLVLLSLVLGLVLLLTRTGGNRAVVYVNGEEVGSYPLGVDRELRIRQGEEYNVLTIADGRARITEASCPDKLCVHMHAIEYVGESIICLPHRLEVRVEGRGEPEVDVP